MNVVIRQVRQRATATSSRACCRGTRHLAQPLRMFSGSEIISTESEILILFCV